MVEGSWATDMMTLYDAFVPGCLQILGSVSNLIDKAEAHCTSMALPPETLINARLTPDMADFAYQVKSCAVHSIGAIDGARKGVVAPDRTPPPDSFAGLRALAKDAADRLGALRAADVEALSDKTVIFAIGDVMRWEFTGQDLLMSLSQPNFYFHATTAYDILRVAGLPLSKTDYLGAIRKTP
ncbi:DUF1993 domain-containing protein [Sphingobium sp. AN641]|uniref:DUF1993 domain-containing protein n=1 Tax=Sphingobium sp. AN641 TaxID=3133443 RepID=UPI0030BD26C9